MPLTFAALAPQYPSVVVGDDHEPTGFFDTAAHLVSTLTAKYSIDSDRLYCTGQSTGAMMTPGLNIRYPDLFAASWVVAGQWPAAQAAPRAGKNLWVTVSPGDTKACPGENAIMSVIEKAGTEVARAVWDGRSTAALRRGRHGDGGEEEDGQLRHVPQGIPP